MSSDSLPDLPNPSPSAGRSELEEVRRELVARVLDAFVGLGFVALVPSVLASFGGGLPLVAVFDVVVYGLLVLAARSTRASAVARARWVVGLSLVVGVTLMFSLGPGGVGLTWLAGAVILGAALLGARAAVLTGIASVVSVGAASVWFARAPVPFAPFSAVAWAAFVANAAVVGGGCAAVVARIVTRLAGSIDRERAALERVRVEEAARRAAELELAHARRIESIGHLASGVAHDFRNLLQPIVALAPEVEAALPPGSEAAEDVRVIGASAGRCVALVERLMQLARKGGSRSDTVNVRELVEDVVALARSSMPPGVELEGRCAVDDDAEVEGDRLELEQALLNLLANAAHAMRGRSGAVVVEAGRAPDGGVELAVRDAGVGMPRAVLDRLFEPYYTTKPPGEGTGLGMAVVARIVASHRGEITVASEPGAGTVVTLRLPVSPAWVPEPPSALGQPL